jgi:ABC-type sulfate transport system substrate-binding protein
MADLSSIQQAAATSAGVGGGGVDPSYINASLTNTNLVNAGADITQDVTGGSLNINPSGTEKWEIVFEGTVRLLSANASSFGGSILITDNANAVVDGASAAVVVANPAASIVVLKQVRLTARVTINSAQTYKLRMYFFGPSASEMSCGGSTYSGVPSANKFYAKRVY